MKRDVEGGCSTLCKVQSDVEILCDCLRRICGTDFHSCQSRLEGCQLQSGDSHTDNGRTVFKLGDRSFLREDGILQSTERKEHLIPYRFRIGDRILLAFLLQGTAGRGRGKSGSHRQIECCPGGDFRDRVSA